MINLLDRLSNYLRDIKQTATNGASNLIYIEQNLQIICAKLRLHLKDSYLAKISEVLNSKLNLFPSYFCLVISHNSCGPSRSEEARMNF